MSDDIDPMTRKREVYHYAESGNLEAHVLADLLRIESITVELREFKTDTKQRLNRIENWLMVTAGTAIVTMISALGTILYGLLF